jgi:beta-glucosidase
MFVDVRVDERALREIYLPAFEVGVKEGNVWTVMSAYNKVNGPHCSANTYLLTDILKKEWGYDGLVMSDWGGVHETAIAQAGNDLEMPGGKFATVEKLKAALADGSLTQAAVDQSARRVLRAVLRVGLLDNPPEPDPEMVNTKAHQQLALEAARKCIVLLKNDEGILPLDRSQVKTIAVIGKPSAGMQIGALGSPQVTPPYTIELLDGIRKQVGSDIAVT